MDTSNWIYLKLVELSPAVRLKNGLKPTTKNRLDCISAYFPNNDYRGLTYFVNPKNQMYFSKTASRTIVKSDIKRQAVWSLTGKSINISSMYIDIPEYPQFAHGNPPSAEILGKKKPKPNPFLLYRNDLFLFKINQDYSEVELFIIPDQKNLWNTYYLKFIQGQFDEDIEKMRSMAKTFFDYGL